MNAPRDPKGPGSAPESASLVRRTRRRALSISDGQAQPQPDQTEKTGPSGTLVVEEPRLGSGLPRAVGAAPSDPAQQAAPQPAAQGQLSSAAAWVPPQRVEPLPHMAPLPSTNPVPSDGAPRRWLTWQKALLIVAGSGLLLLGAAALGLYLTLEHFAKGLPSVEKLKAGYDPPQITRIQARDGTLLASVFTERRTVIPFDQVPDAAKLAFLAAEDAAFYEHEGLNYLGMLRALYANIRAGHSVQGGSSITQQVVKNVLLDAERTYKRKIRESILALRLEQSLTKDEIFWLYLNHIYLGHGRYGIQEAARFYFGKPARELALDEAATLAGLVAAPERFSPRKDPEKALARRAYVLDQMQRKGFVTPQLFAEVSARPLRLPPSEETESRLAPEIVDRVKSELKKVLGDAGSGGYNVVTSIDPELQAAARRAVRENLDAFMQRHKLVAPFTNSKNAEWGAPFSGQPKVHRIYNGVVVSTDDRTNSIDVKVGDAVGRVALTHESRYNPSHLPASEFTKPGTLLRVSLLESPLPDSKPAMRLELGPQSVLLALDVRTRAIVALVGSYEAVTGGLDRATASRRQPGSAIKPLIYSYALHTGKFTPASMLQTHKLLNGGVERDGKYYLSMRQALAQSNNESSVQLLVQSGPANVVKWAQDFGIESKLEPDVSLALGAYEVIPLELANAFAVFASGGILAAPRFITKLEAPNGSPVELPPSFEERRVLSPELAYLTTSLLRGVVETGTAQAARRLGREVAGKTGTTNDNKDAWFVGYSTDIVTLVWVGYDDAIPLGKHESGSKTALPAWINFMEAAHKGRPKTSFTRPDTILAVQVDPSSGLLPRPGQFDTRSEEFLPGSEPSAIAPEPVSSEPTITDPVLPPDGSELPPEQPAPAASAAPAPQAPAAPKPAVTVPVGPTAQGPAPVAPPSPPAKGPHPRGGPPVNP